MFMVATSVYIERYNTRIIRSGCLMPEVLKVWPLVGSKTNAEGACLQRPSKKKTCRMQNALTYAATVYNVRLLKGKTPSAPKVHENTTWISITQLIRSVTQPAEG